LFKWQKGGNKAAKDFPIDYNADHVFFANQVINNACATQAILSILLNRDDIEIGDELNNFKEFTADFPPDVCES
jgi:ubiquitin carboxyl-terminal hydrolase L5